MTTDVNSRSGGIYIPPFKLARMHAESPEPSSAAGQRMEWERARKSIRGLVNKVNTSNIKDIVQELFVENLLKHRGLFVRAIMQAQISSPTFSDVFAALVAVINSKLPEIGDLLLRRLILQFRKAYMRNDEMLLTCVCKFLGHLFNQHVVADVVILQIIMIFLEKLSNDSIKLCCILLTETGAALSKASPKGIYLIFERIRLILQEGAVDKRIQYIVEDLYEERRTKFANHPGVPVDLDLIEEADQHTHEIDVIEGSIDGEDMLNMFESVDAEEFLKQQTEWTEISNDILGIVEGEEYGSEYEGEEMVDVKVEEGTEAREPVAEKPQVRVSDMTEQDLINLRRTIYLAIMSSANFEECVHKILSLNLRSGQEREVVSMLIESSAMDKTSNRFYSLQGERLCRLSRVYKSLFESAFSEQYDVMHRNETNKIRNIAKFFSHLLFADSIDWAVLRSVQLTESDTNSSTRIFLKILFQDLNENMGGVALFDRLNDPRYAEALSGVFGQPDDPEHMRFSINFFTAIGLGSMTTELRQRLNEFMVRNVMAAEPRRPSPPRRERSRTPVRKSGYYSESDDEREKIEVKQEEERRSPDRQRRRTPPRRSPPRRYEHNDRQRQRYRSNSR